MSRARVPVDDAAFAAWCAETDALIAEGREIARYAEAAYGPAADGCGGRTCRRLDSMSDREFQRAVNGMLAREACGRALANLRWLLRQRVLWPLVLLLVRARIGDTFPEPQRAGDGRPLDDLSPPLSALLARATLTAAPPARVPCQAGATG